MIHNTLKGSIEVTNSDMDIVESRAGKYMLTAVKLVMAYSQGYNEYNGIKIFTFGDDVYTYKLDSLGRLYKQNNETKLFENSKVSSNNVRYQVKAFRLTGGVYNIYDTAGDNEGHVTIHQLMIAAFKLPELIKFAKSHKNDTININHMNGCHYCNTLDNLEICTKGENLAHGALLGLFIRYGYMTQSYEDRGFSIPDCHRGLEYYRHDYILTAQWIKKTVLCGANVKMVAKRIGLEKII